MKNKQPIIDLDDKIRALELKLSELKDRRERMMKAYYGKLKSVFRSTIRTTEQKKKIIKKLQ